jgi:hypothetical protein
MCRTLHAEYFDMLNVPCSHPAILDGRSTQLIRQLPARSHRNSRVFTRLNCLYLT